MTTNSSPSLDASPFSIDVQILDDFGTPIKGPMLSELGFNVTLSMSQTTNCAIEFLPVRSLSILVMAPRLASSSSSSSATHTHTP